MIVEEPQERGTGVNDQGVEIMAAAVKLAKQLGITDFKGSEEWGKACQLLEKCPRIDTEKWNLLKLLCKVMLVWMYKL